MRRLVASTALVVVTVVSAALLPVASPDALAGATAKGAAPFLRTPDASQGAGVLSVAVKGADLSVSIAVSGLPASVTAPLGVFVETSAGSGDFAQVASIASLRKGAGKVVLTAGAGLEAFLGGGDLASAVGRAVEIRDGGGTAHLRARVPAAAKFTGTKLSAKFGPADGSPLTSFSAKFTGTPDAKTGGEKFLLKVKGLAPGTLYTLHVEDAAGSETFVSAGAIVNGQFLRDQSKGDALPLDAPSLLDLVGRAVEVRSPAGAVGRGVIPFLFAGSTWPQLIAFGIDEPGTDLDRVLSYKTGIVIYRDLVDFTQTSKEDLTIEGEAVWRVAPRGVAPGGGMLFTARLASDDAFWWSSAKSGNDHYLGVYRTDNTPSSLEQFTFVLRVTGDDGHGRRVATVESVLYPGEFVLNSGHNLTGNGARIGQGVAVPLILR